ncbi:MAG: DUF349 domain-containing protein [Bacteroidales bacterium]|nr:DUF349 domain-containing protein [Bacteroidales bacterium]
MSAKDLQNSDSVQDEQLNENSELNENNEIANSEKEKIKKEEPETSEKKESNKLTEEESKNVDSTEDDSNEEIKDQKDDNSETSEKEESSELTEDKSNNVDSIEDDLNGEIKEQKNDDSEDVEVEVEPASTSADKADSTGGEEKIEIDYTKLSREDLVKELNNIIDKDSINEIRREVEAIKASFYKKQKVLNEKKRKEFLAEGGDIEDFAPVEDPLETELKELFKRYRRFKADYNRQLEKVKDVNLEKKYEIIEVLKELVNKDESIGDTFKEFRELQKLWKDIGQVPQQKLKDLWNTYHHHVEKFYDYVNINKELRDLDLKKNLEIKTVLCEKSEKLIEETSVVTAFKTLQKFHNQWREIGPVPNDQKDILWERFKEATRIINKRHQDYFKNLKDEQKSNLEKKEKLCEQAEEVSEKELSFHKDWTDQTKSIIELQKVWRTIGFAPKKDNNKIYARFRNACDKFFGKKREFYAQNKEQQDENLNKKIELCEKVELLKDSTDWKKTTKDLINLQKEWKEIGPVSRKQSDKVWKRFRAACDHFFNSKSEYYVNIEQEFEKNLKLKQEIIEKVKNYQFVNDVNVNSAALKKFQEDFTEVGFVPYKMKDKIQNTFREELNKQFDKLKVDDSEKNLLKFQNRLETLQHKPKSSNKIKYERDKFFNKISKLENNISLWENNIGFFSAGSDEAKEMLKEYHAKIESAHKEIILLKEKIRMIDRTDSE